MARYLLRQGHVLIALGMLLVIAGQFWSAVPVVTAIAVIGRGAILILQSRPRTTRQDSLIVVNLAVYGVLVSLAIVAQSNAVLQVSGSRVSLGMLLDHSVAIVLLIGLIYDVLVRISQPTA